MREFSAGSIMGIKTTGASVNSYVHGNGNNDADTTAPK